jgi:hypothetical protein
MITEMTESSLPAGSVSLRPGLRIALAKSCRNIVTHALATLTVIACLAGPADAAQARPQTFAFVGQQYIMTAEVSGAHQFILNFVNLSEFVVVVQPSEFIYRGASGQFYIGQVFDQQTKGTRGDVYRYSASILLTSFSFKGLNIVGAFHEQDQITELSIRIGAKRFYFQALEKAQFDQVVARVELLDMKNREVPASLRSAGLTEFGQIRTPEGIAEWDRDWQNLLMPDGINPPRIVERPPITPTEDARRTNTYGVVKLSAIITRDGTILEPTVVKGLGHGLDDRAIEVVRSSWIFLPATKNGEVVETSIKFDVTFPPPKKSPN